jgi:protein-S-isoprenylcysteine O-methyltransferase Ste14
VNGLLGLLFILAGLLFGLWSNYVQFTIGRGTPVPIMATQQLIVQPPYSYCRNPMALGAIMLYLGIAIWLGSLSALGMVLESWGFWLRSTARMKRLKSTVSPRD